MTAPFDAFGPGVIVVTRTDVANSTPYNIGYAQEFSVDFAGNIKELYGQNQMPIDAARGTVKVTGKIKAAVLSGFAWNTVFFGNSFSTGTLTWNTNEKHTVTAGVLSPAAITNAATFEADLGVVYDAAATTPGMPLTKVASAPAVGQYTVSGVGVYAFAAGETNPVLINYTSAVAASGQTLTISNNLLGTSPNFQLDYYTARSGSAFVVRYYQAQAAKITIAAKLEDFIMPEFEIHFFANAAGNLGKLYFPEKS